MAFLIVPLPGDHMSVAASEYGVVSLGFGADDRGDLGGGFHSSGDDGDDWAAEGNGAAGAAARAASVRSAAGRFPQTPHLTRRPIWKAPSRRYSGPSLAQTCRNFGVYRVDRMQCAGGDRAPR